jgi:hypothetical protein
MRLKCVKIKSRTSEFEPYKGLTVGKYYDILAKDSLGYQIVNDNDYLGWCVKDYFESIDEMRDNKLNEIGI